jgi:hypothetical protein
MVARAVRHAAAVVLADGAVRDKRADFAEFAAARDFELPARSQGWARRPAKGETYGATYVGPYRDTIAALYARGNANKACKVSPDQVREQLVRSHPGKFCLPGVWALQNVFISLGQKKPACDAAGGGRREHASKLPADLCRAVDEIVAADTSIKPAAVLARVKCRFPQLDSTLHKRVTQRVSAVKTKLNKRNAGL